MRTAAATPAPPAGALPRSFSALSSHPELMIVESEPANMPAIKSNKLAERPHTPVFANGPGCVESKSGVDRFHRRLPEQAFDKRGRSRVIEHEAIVSRQRQAESAQVRQVGETVA